MKYYIIAGEASGDLHAANLMREITKLNPTALFRVWGGDRMRNEGGELVKHHRELAFMGFYEVLANLSTILYNFRFCKNDILTYRPDAIILIDYPGFNLRIAEFAHKHGIRVFYYISPQVWAWKKSRVRKIRKFVERLFVILPFEKDFYARHGVDVDFVGHPLLDAIENEKNNLTDPGTFRNHHLLDKRPIIALLPGSREQEISTMLPVMLSVKNDFPDYQFVVAGASAILEDFYKAFITDHSVRIIFNQTHDLLHNAAAALVTSGTATLETALMDVPQVVCYKGNWISFQIAKRIVNIKYISLVNLIMDKQVVTELIQDQMNPGMIKKELIEILGEPARSRIRSDYMLLREKLGFKGASALTAKLIVERMCQGC
ncbi:MAG: lipid-A-disaccharide synthase [Bacteroidales bacterium]|nr:lipid-A-disaccharide synthase [Bacteroidales bacterium]